MTRPRRIQLSRRIGWRKPEGAVVVARPTRWGNPFAIGKHVEGEPIETRDQAVAAFREMLEIDDRNYPSITEIEKHLRGKDLACWCPLDKPCHADVLLRIANERAPDG